MRANTLTLAVGVLVALLPWQARWIITDVWGDLAVLSVYATQVAIIGVYFAIFRGRLELSKDARVLILVGLLVAGVVGLSAAFAEYSLLSIQLMAQVISGVGLFSMVADRRVDRGVVLRFFLLGLVASVAIGGFQMVTGGFPASTMLGVAERSVGRAGDAVMWLNGERVLRAYGLFSHPNIFGGYLAAGLLWFVIWGRKWIVSEWRWWALAGVMVIGLLMTYSQGAWLALMVGVLTYILLNWQKKCLGVRGMMGIVVELALIGTVSLSIVAPMVLERIGHWSDSVEERGFLIRQSLNTIITHPIIGVGAGNYAVFLQDGDVARWWAYQPVHHIMLLMVAELGVALFIALVMMIWFVFKMNNTIVPRPILPVLALLFVLGTVDHYLWTQWSGIALIALTFGLREDYS